MKVFLLFHCISSHIACHRNNNHEWYQDYYLTRMIDHTLVWNGSIKIFGLSNAFVCCRFHLTFMFLISMKISETLMSAWIVSKIKNHMHPRALTQFLPLEFLSAFSAFVYSTKFWLFQNKPKTSTSSAMMNITKETMIMIRIWKTYKLIWALHIFWGKSSFSI